MAGEILSLEELTNWYNKFNNVISNYGGGAIKSLELSSDITAKASDINNIYNKINEFKSDSYLSTQPQLYSDEYSLVSSGNLIVRSSQATPIQTTINGISQIKCRNKITYGSGTCSSGSLGQWCGNQRCSSGGKTYNWYVNGWNTDGTQSNGSNSNGSKIDILNAKTS